MSTSSILAAPGPSSAVPVASWTRVAPGRRGDAPDDATHLIAARAIWTKNPHKSPGAGPSSQRTTPVEGTCGGFRQRAHNPNGASGVLREVRRLADFQIIGEARLR